MSSIYNNVSIYKIIYKKNDNDNDIDSYVN